MITIINNLLIVVSVLSICIGVAIVICYCIHIKTFDRRIEESRRFYEKMEKLKAEKNASCSEDIVPLSVIHIS